MVNSARTPRPRTGEVAAAGGRSDITTGYVSQNSLLPYQDSLLNTAKQYSILNKGGHDLRLFEAVLEDDQVFSTMQQRIRRVLRAEWSVTAKGERRVDIKAADFIRDELTRTNFDDLTEKMLYGVFYGFSFAEAIWMRDGDRVRVDACKVRNRRRFRFKPNGGPRLLTLDNQHEGIALPDRKFWWFATGGDNHDNPYGQGLARWCYWPVFFKKHGIKYWLKFLEKFGRPTAKGTYPAGATQEQKDALLEIAQAVGEYDAVTMPEGQMLDLIEAGRGGSASYETLHETMNKAISKVVLSQTMTTDDGSSRSQSETHDKVALAIAKSDSDLICSSFNNSVVKWLTDWNFPGAAYPQVWRDTDPPKDLKPQAERDKILFDMGFVPGVEYVQETYGDGFGLPEEGEVQGLNGAQIQALVDIIGQVADGSISVNAGRQLAMLAIPALDEEQVARLIEEPPPEPIESVPGEDDNSIMLVNPDEVDDAEFAEADDPDTVVEYSEQLRSAAGPIIDGWVDQVRSELSDVSDLAEFAERISGLYPKLKGDDLRRLVNDALTAASIAGAQEDLSAEGRDEDLV